MSDEPRDRKLHIQSAEPSGLMPPEETAPGAEQASEAQATQQAPEPDEAARAEQEEDWKRKHEQKHDLYLRAVAELANYKRRAQADLADRLRFANRELISALLPIVDNLDRALDIKPDSPGCESLHDGVRMIRDQFYNILTDFGLAPIEAVGQPFDPLQHEAVECVETDDHEEGTVIAELLKGYLMHDRLVRPAKVVVSTKKSLENIRGGTVTDEETPA